MTLFIGDSNLRASIEENQTYLKTLFSGNTTFEQAGTNDAVKIILEKVPDEDTYGKIFIGTILNEIAYKGKPAKTRDEIINTITRQQAELVKIYLANSQTLTSSSSLRSCVRTLSGCQTS